IVLVLPHANGFWLNFNQFGKRVCQAPAYGYSATHGYIIIWEFLPCNFGCRINRSSRFTDHKDLYIVFELNFPDKAFCFPGSSSVTDGYSFYFMGICQRTNLFDGSLFVILWGV